MCNWDKNSWNIRRQILIYLQTMPISRFTATLALGMWWGLETPNSCWDLREHSNDLALHCVDVHVDECGGCCLWYLGTIAVTPTTINQKLCSSSTTNCTWLSRRNILPYPVSASLLVTQRETLNPSFNKNIWSAFSWLEFSSGTKSTSEWPAYPILP